MKIISLFSVKGGTGRTSLATHLGGVLTHGNVRTLVVEADPQNGLGQWLGAEPGERMGLSRRSLSSSELLQFLRRLRVEVPFLPFGQCPDDELAQLEETWRHEPHWLRRRIEELAGNDYDVILLDAQAGRTPLAYQALRASNMVLAILLPDAASYATVPMMEDLLNQHCRGRANFSGAYYLVNQMDARFELSRDVKAALTGLLSQAVLPMAVPFDESLREAGAQRQTLFHRHPDSQVIATLREIGSWIAEAVRQSERQLLTANS